MIRCGKPPKSRRKRISSRNRLRVFYDPNYERRGSTGFAPIGMPTAANIGYSENQEPNR